jgi:hypothetical protein
MNAAGQAQPLRTIIRNITGRDLPPHEVRGQLMDWENENHEDVLKLTAHARAVKVGRPLRSYVVSAEEMSEIVLRLFG